MSWLADYFQSAFVVDKDGVARLRVTDTATADDGTVKIVGRYGSTSTPDATDRDIALPYSIDDGSLWAFDCIVTAKGSGVRRRIKLSGLVRGVGVVATFDGSVDVDEKGTGAATATLYVDGATSTVFLRLTPGSSTPLAWGFEVRGQMT